MARRAAELSESPGPNPSAAKKSVALRLRKRWRVWLRALHRDAGYLAIGLTCIYAISGIAINHLEDWDPNFAVVEQTHHLGQPVSGDEATATAFVLNKLDIHEQPSDFYMASDTELEIYLDRRTLRVDVNDGTVYDEAAKPRFFIRVANWLHYNRGKKAWTFIADGYAFFLLFLAASGAFMLAGKKGLRGRGGLLIGVGVAIPVLYVTLSSGP